MLLAVRMQAFEGPSSPGRNSGRAAGKEVGGVHLHHTPEYPFCRNSELVLSWKQFLMLKSLKAYWLISLRNIKGAGKEGNYDTFRNKCVPAPGRDFYIHIVLFSFFLHENLEVRYYHPQLTDKETQREQVTFSGSHSIGTRI